MSFQWDVHPERVFSVGMARYARNLDAEIRAIADRRAPQIAEWMKQNHPWQNRTGAAEEGLHTEVRQMVQQMVEIILAHGDDVPYGIWLEVRHQGAYSIIAPALDHWSEIVWSDVRRMMHR